MFDIDKPCTFCETKASYYILDVLSGSKKEWYLCAACVDKYDTSGYLKLFAVPLNQVPSQLTDIKCPKCGMTMSKFMRTKRVGCDQDYELFNLGTVLKEYHKAECHVGKVPSNHKLPPEAISNRLDQLKTAMEQAIDAEKYEDAARLRDEIKLLKKDLQ